MDPLGKRQGIINLADSPDFGLRIQYEYSSPVTMNYWFTHGGNTMWMQWRTGNGAVQTYVYDRMDRAPW